MVCHTLQCARLSKPQERVCGPLRQTGKWPSLVSMAADGLPGLTASLLTRPLSVCLPSRVLIYQPCIHFLLNSGIHVEIDKFVWQENTTNCFTQHIHISIDKIRATLYLCSRGRALRPRLENALHSPFYHNKNTLICCMILRCWNWIMTDSKRKRNGI